MPRYHVTGAVTGSKYMGEFEADSPEEAIELAMAGEGAHCSVCHHCSSQVEDPEIHEAFADEVKCR